MASAKPTLLLLQGAFQPTDFYDGLTNQLRAHGYEVVHPELPTCSDADAPDFPQRTVSTDAVVVRRALDALLAQDKTVVLLLHSYGGLLGAEAVLEAHSAAHRAQHGRAGGVARLIYIAAFALPVGMCPYDVTGGVAPDDSDIRPDGRNHYRFPRERLLEDLPPARQDALLPRLLTLPAGILEYKMTNAAYAFVPASYIVSEKDRSIAAAQQEAVAASVQADPIERLPFGHMPHLREESTTLLVDAILRILSSKGL